MNPKIKSTFRKFSRPFVNLLRFFYLLIDDRKSFGYFPKWLSSFRKGHSPLNDGLPWLPFAATDWLQSYLKPEMSVFEFGSGGSTIFFAQHCDHVFSVEHEKEWHSVVLEKLSILGLQNCAYQLHEPQPLSEENLSDPDKSQFMVDEKHFDSFCFNNYIKSIDSHPNQTFDLVLVDGRARASAIERAIPKIKKGGFLMLDNSNDQEFTKLIAELKSFPQIDFYGIAPWWPPKRWRTSLWQLT